MCRAICAFYTTTQTSDSNQRVPPRGLNDGTLHVFKDPPPLPSPPVRLFVSLTLYVDLDTTTIDG